MHLIRRQAGVTGIGWMIILGLMGFFVFLTLKMLPSYLDYFKVAAALESLEKETMSTPVEIRKHLERQFDVSFVTVITPKQIKIKNAGQAFNVTAKYDDRVHMVANVDIVMSYDKQVMVPKR
jgi:anion-transporting  ArsA/GET3 family ATPase